MKKVVIPMIALSIISVPPIDVAAIDENNSLETSYSEVNDNEQEQGSEEIVNQVDDNSQEAETNEIKTESNNTMDTTQNEDVITYADEATADKQVQVGNLETTVNEDETEVRVELKDTDIKGLGRDIRFAVWSEEGGQDDLRWYTATKDSKGNYVYNVKIKDHRTAGSYNVHCYMYGNDGSMTMLTKTTFDISKPEVNMKAENLGNGKFKVSVEIGDSKQNVSRVMIPVWSEKNGQDDLKWYTAQKEDAMHYSKVIEVTNHKGEIGLYRYASYVTLANGIEVKPAENDQLIDIEVQVGNLETTVNEDETEVRVELKDTDIKGLGRDIRFAVWSEEGGQDDLRWYTATKDSKGNYVYNVKIKDHRTAGSYNVHCYMYGNDGSMTMLTKITFDIVKKAEVTIQSFTSKDNGEFVMELATTTPNLISKIQVPTWRDSDQNDIVWYDAQKINDTTYRVVMNIANHKHHIGQYNLHVYATLKNGIRHFTCANTQEVTVTNYTYIEKVRDRVYTLNIINPNGGNAQRVQIPTWSESNGQDDIIWYEASNSGSGLWSATLTTTNHKHAGRYFAHYYVTADNITQKVAENSFTVSQSEMLTGMDLRAQNYTSSTDKLILVDLTNHTVGVYNGRYQEWRNIQSYICTVGAPSTPTIVGEFTIYMHRAYFDSGSSRCFYFSPFKGGYGFHSVLYYQDPSPTRIKDGRLGMDLSHGCVRLDVNHAKWIYDNCPIGTKVVIYR